MHWLLMIAAVWLALSGAGALVIGRAIRLADRPEPAVAAAPRNFAVDLPLVR